MEFFMSFLGRDPGLIIFFDPVSEAIFASLPHESVSIHVNNFFLILLLIFFDPLGIIFFDPLINFFLIPHPCRAGGRTCSMEHLLELLAGAKHMLPLHWLGPACHNFQQRIILINDKRSTLFGGLITS